LGPLKLTCSKANYHKILTFIYLDRIVLKRSTDDLNFQLRFTNKVIRKMLHRPSNSWVRRHLNMHIYGHIVSKRFKEKQVFSVNIVFYCYSFYLLQSHWSKSCNSSRNARK